MARGPGKGKTNNPNGRPKGVPNRTTTEAREFLDCMMYGQLDNMNDALNTLYDKDKRAYIDACSKLFGFVLPKKTDITTAGKEIPSLPAININLDAGNKPDSE